jgi:hypothetical protein
VVEGNNAADVPAAFEILLEEIEAEIEFNNQIGAKLFESSDYKKIQAVLEHVEQLNAFRDKVVVLKREYLKINNQVNSYEINEEEKASASRRSLSRLPRGMRTPQEAYYQPILSVLVDMGGAAKMNDILTQVEIMMKGILKDVDYESLASAPDMPRWRNAAQWARQAMVQEGLLKADSPRGFWEISESGRKWLESKHPD